MFSPSLIVLLASAGLIEARSLHEFSHLNLHKRQQNRQGGIVLNPAVVQIGSTVTGDQSLGANVNVQAKSETSTENFINYCLDKQLTNGFQFLDGSCNGIPMGDIPAKSNMISSIITFPQHLSAEIQANTDFVVTVQTTNLIAGSFTNAAATYYGAPQFLQGGKVVGHTHITIQDMNGDFNPTQPMDPEKFAFFKGVNDAGNGQGLLSANVSGGLPAGKYRVCTLTGASNHQPVLMPVAQRGTADDCSKFEVIGNGNVKNVAANDGTKGLANLALIASAIELGPGAIATPPAASASASSTVTDDSSDATTTAATDDASATESSAAETTSATFSTLPPFSNSTTTRAGNGGGKGNGRPTRTRTGKKPNATKVRNPVNPDDSAPTSSAAGVVSTTAAAATTKASGGNGGGKGNGGKGNGGKGNAGTKVQTAVQAKPTGKRIIIVIKTFFLFNKGRGGHCPSVGKNGNKFSVLEELFDSLAEAAAAACGHQFTSCITFKGPGFSVEECVSQKDECNVVASTASATATTPATLTASVTIPITASATGLPGSVVAIETIAPTSTVAAAPQTTAAAAQTTAAGAVATDAPAADESVCSIVTQTVTVEAPAVSSVSVAAASTIVSSLPTLIPTKAPFSNSSTPVRMRST